MDEYVDHDGDVWLVRECDADHDCVVLERYLTHHTEGGDFPRIPANKQTTDDLEEAFQDRPETDPADEVHIPLDAIPAVVQMLQEFAAVVKRRLEAQEPRP